jgi:hypothetical protein
MARIPVLISAFVLLGAVSALAQDAPNPAGPPPGGPGPGMERPPMGGRGGWMGMHRGHMMMRDKAASFRFKKDGAEISIRCASNEPTKACVDAAALLIDKVSSVTPK